MNSKSIAVVFALATTYTSALYAQDYNYVPGWANTQNHSYRGKGGGGEWEAKKTLFATLGAQGPEAKCTLRNLSDPDGNVITNQYRSDVRKRGEHVALKNAQRKVAAHHKTLKSQGKC